MPVWDGVEPRDRDVSKATGKELSVELRTPSGGGTGKKKKMENETIPRNNTLQITVSELPDCREVVF